ncbi:hypothetical protein [Citricoccus sp. I39-566]|uniref:hypothetical protein n=1 Tax=Citricoccus sp. I39-566 TaxID=3073268 RepID=UPI002869FDD8|nr:hypothetical protein [Citricoccus sp. I39-566]WMY78059.1 hypothetical protein RE421_14715 [Citricoccus sp. I39-566]
MNQRTYVGLDVHARSIVGCAIDQRTGNVLHQRLPINYAGAWWTFPGLVGQPVGGSLNVVFPFLRLDHRVHF